jgi:hypothetical protein
MTEHCPDHNYLVQTVGSIDGKIDMLIEGQKEFKANISELYQKYNDTNIDSAVQRTKTAPIFWVIMAIAAVLITIGVTSFVNTYPVKHTTQENEVRK